MSSLNNSSRVDVPWPVTVLTGIERAARKEFGLDADGRLNVASYGNEYRFTQNQAHVSGIRDLGKLVERLSGHDKSIIVRGSPVNPSSPVTRKKRNFPERPEGCPWVMLDFDGIPLPENIPPLEAAAIEYLVRKLPAAFHEVSYFYQFSSSAGILRPDGTPYKAGVSAHVFFWLDRPMPGELVAAWLRTHCIDAGFFEKRFNTVEVPRIVYGVDDSVIRSSVQPHYVAMPLIGEGVLCVLSAQHRQRLVEKLESSVVLPVLDNRVVEAAKSKHRVLDDAWKQENGFRLETLRTRAANGEASSMTYYQSSNASVGRTGRTFLSATINTLQRSDGTSYLSATLFFEDESSRGSWYVVDNDPTTARHHGGDRQPLKQLSSGAFDYVRDELKWFEELADVELDAPRPVWHDQQPERHPSTAAPYVEIPEFRVELLPMPVGHVDNHEPLRGLAVPSKASREVPDPDIIHSDFAVGSGGVFYLKKSPEGRISPVWLSSKVDVVALARSVSGESWGLVVVFDDLDGMTHQWCIQNRMFGADLGEVWTSLLNMGLQLTVYPSDRLHLSRYFQTCTPAQRWLAATQSGWNDNGANKCFVFPDGSVYGQGDQSIAYETRDPTSGRAFQSRGNLDDWKETVGVLCERNSRMIMAVCAALCGPALDGLKEESGGFHFRGASSIGKTTTLSIAASVFGHPEQIGKTWRATSNALEAVAALHNDMVLPLDELSQVAPKDANAAAYMLAQGQGKARATVSGGARTTVTWRVVIISTGEVSLADHLASDGIRGMAGQEARLIDIEADAGTGFGLFEALHGEAGGAALSVRLKAAASQSYGTAGRAFVAALTDRDRREQLLADIRQNMAEFQGRCVPNDAAGQVHRVARRFALVAAVGEECIRLKILPWAAGQATWGVHQCFASWLEGRGGAGNLEVSQAIRQVRHHLATHGSLHYQQLNRSGPYADSMAPRGPRYGYQRPGSDGRTEFLIESEAFRDVVCRGLNSKAVIDVLKSSGFLVLARDGKNQQQVRIPERGQVRFYVISADLLGDGDDAAAVEPSPSPPPPPVSPLASNCQV